MVNQTKFLKKKLFLLLILGITSLLQIYPVNANEISGYIGQQSFRIEDDPGLYDLSRAIEDLKIELARIDQSKSQFEDLVRVLEQQRNNQLDKMNALQNEINGSKATITSLQTKLEELKKDPEVNKDQIVIVSNNISATAKSIDDKLKQYGQLKIDLGPLNVRLDQVRADYNVVLQRSHDASNRLQIAARKREAYKTDLIASISFINREGANRGQVDGTNDGYSLAKRLGQDLGVRDGEGDGLYKGTLEGQDRFYKRGSDAGERDGSARARLDGLRDGTKEGTISGNRNAGYRDGSLAGAKRGDASNASAVGIEQGKIAGMERARSTGAINGNMNGEKETVKKIESGNLSTINMNGPFAGSFQRHSPDYPGDFNGPSFNPKVFNNKEILKKAYLDGYLDTYRGYTRYEFLRRIDGEYNSQYDSRYTTSYNQAVNRDYPEYFEKGRILADARAYSRDYPIVKADAFQVAFERADATPNRSGSDYLSSYKSSELDAFNKRFEEIRRANFDRLEQEVFNANIAAQTEIYRQKRIVEVTKVYNNNAILAFVNSEIFDGGIRGIAKLDGVFQPGETTIHNVTLQNFGFKAAQNVSVQLDSGEIVKLAEIPARSLVKIIGAGLSTVAANAAIGSNSKKSLKVISQLTSDDAVEGQYFDSIGSGILKRADQKQFLVSYPLSLSGLTLNGQLLKGVGNKLSLSVTNMSKRAFNGHMKIQLTANSQANLISKEFSEVTNLVATTQLTDAEVLVASDADIYRDLSFSATISENGVLLGVLPADLVVMAKAQYLDGPKKGVIIANSDKNLKSLLDALSLAGGTEKVSVLDLSLASQNAVVLANGLSGKVLLVVDNDEGTNMKTLNNFVGKSKSSTFVFIDENNTGLKNALALGSTKDAQKLLWDKRAVVFTNPYRAEGVLKSSAMIQSSLISFDQDFELASDLSLTAPELLSKLKTEVNGSTFFTPNKNIKMFSLKALSEILCINKAYDESGRIFSRDKKWINMIGNDSTLFINVLKSASIGEVTNEKLGAVLSALAMKETLSNAMSNAEGIYRVMMIMVQNATNKVLGNMEDDFKKSLKNFNKDLYNKAYAQVAIHRPFFIDPPRTNNQN
jgi:sulfur carrier protein ThiS